MPYAPQGLNMSVDPQALKRATPVLGGLGSSPNPMPQGPGLVPNPNPAPAPQVQQPVQQQPSAGGKVLSREQFKKIVDKGVSDGIDPKEMIMKIRKAGHTIEQEEKKGFLTEAGRAIQQRRDNVSSKLQEGRDAIQNADNSLGGYLKGQLRDTTSKMASVGQAVQGVADIAFEGVENLVQEGLNDEREENAKRNFSMLGNDILKTKVGQAGIRALKKGSEVWETFEKHNPNTANVLSSVINVADVVGVGAIGKKVGKEAVEAGASQALKASDMATEFAKNFNPSDIVKEPIKAVSKVTNKGGELVDIGTEKIASKLLGTTDDQGKLFKAQEPRTGQLNKSVDYENLRKNSDIANEEIIKAGYTPKDTATRAKAHADTMKKIWNDEIASRIGNKSDINLNKVADELDKFIKEIEVGGIVKHKGQLSDLKEQSKAFRKKGSVNGADGEFINQMLNSQINNWGDASIGDVYKNGLKRAGQILRKSLDDSFSSIPGEFSDAKRRFGALKATYKDVIKADIKNQRSKGLGIAESFSRIEGIGDILGSIISRKPSDAVKGISKVIVGKTLGKIKDKDLLIREGFKGLRNKNKLGIDVGMKPKNNTAKSTKGLRP